MTRRRSLSTALLFAGLVWVNLVLPWMTVGPAFADPSWDLWDWQQQHKYLKDEVDRVSPHAPPSLKTTRPYIRALEELDSWRKKALDGAQEVQASKDPEIRAMFDDFMDEQAKRLEKIKHHDRHPKKGHVHAHPGHLRKSPKHLPP